MNMGALRSVSPADISLPMSSELRRPIRSLWPSTRAWLHNRRSPSSTFRSDEHGRVAQRVTCGHQFADVIRAEAADTELVAIHARLAAQQALAQLDFQIG